MRLFPLLLFFLIAPPRPVLDRSPVARSGLLARRLCRRSLTNRPDTGYFQTGRREAVGFQIFLEEDSTVVMLGTDMKVAEIPTEGLRDYAKADAYAAWLKTEGVKSMRIFTFRAWRRSSWGPGRRKGVAAQSSTSTTATCPDDCHVVEIKPGGKSEPEHHMYELTIYVVSGRGATTIWHDDKDDKRKQSFEWNAGSLFDSAERLVPELQWQRHGACALYRGYQRASDDASLRRHRVHIQLRFQISRPLCRRGRLLQR